ncbi:MAG: HAD family hydrolase [Mycobacteriales bacterium]
MLARVRLEAVVFDLLYTLVHPGEFPGGGDRTTWLAGLLGVDEQALEARWAAFEPFLESGHAPAIAPLGPELTWLTQVAADLGGPVTPEALGLVERNWDLTRRRALLDPPAVTMDVLTALRSHNLKIGVLSNTHALELRAWPDSPLADLVDAVALSHEIGAMKPARAAYGAILDRLGVPAAAAAYVGDGSSDELAGARRAGFCSVILAAEAPARFTPGRLPALQAQADFALTAFAELPAALSAAHGRSFD